MLGLLAGAGVVGLGWTRRSRPPRPDPVPHRLEGETYQRTSLLRDTIRHRRLTIACGMLAGLLGGLSFTSIIAERQEATAALVLQPLPGNAYGQDPRRDQTEAMQNEAQSVRSDEVLTTAAELIGQDQTVNELQRRVRVQVPPRTTTVRIIYGTTDAATATRNVEQVLTAYVEYRAQRASDAIETRLGALSDQIADVSSQLEQALSIAAYGNSQPAGIPATARRDIESATDRPGIGATASGGPPDIGGHRGAPDHRPRTPDCLSNAARRRRRPGRPGDRACRRAVS